MSCAADTGVTSGFMGAFVGLGYSCTMKHVTWPVLFMGLLMRLWIQLGKVVSDLLLEFGELY